ncbi:hypothetical protein CRYUN_Cryun31cG0061500 [Craigia yunnanensis]
MSPMYSPAVALLFSLFLLLLSAADAFNITQILSPYPDFTAFNNYLIQTGVAGEINSKQTITVLVVANGNMSAVSGQSTDAITKALSMHVILDYYDVAKLQNLPTKTVTLTTLYQASGKAQNQQGFLNVTHVGNGPVAFGSAAPGSKLDSVLVKTISTQPYNISVLQISDIINVGSNPTTPSSPPAQAPAVSPPRKAPAPAPSHKESPAASPPNSSNATAPSADTSAGSNSTTPSSSPAQAPAVSPPKALAPAPSDEESPAASPPNPSITAPSAETPAGLLPNSVADGPGSDNKSSAVSVTSGNYLAAILMVFPSAWFLLTMI